MMSNCEVVTFPIGILDQMWCLIVSLPDLCPLSYFFTINTLPYSELEYDLNIFVLF